MPITIHDVANRAGVSIKTVSRVVNQEMHVRQALREKVLRAMTELNYTPNISARRLSSQRSFTIGLLAEYAGEYLDNILNTCIPLNLQFGYATLVSFVSPGDPRSRPIVQCLVDQKHVDGFILTPACDNDQLLLQYLQDSQVPFVRLTPSDTSLPLPYVAGDDWRGAYEVTTHLIEQGYRRLGHLFGPHAHQASHDRFAGFCAALEAHGLPLVSDWVLDGRFSFSDSMLASQVLLSRSPRPEAVFAANDESAAGLLFVAHQMGLAVPADLAVAGFDDFPTASKIWPSLTTYVQPMAEITAAAVRLLVDLLDGQQPEIQHIRVPARLIVRQSTVPGASSGAVDASRTDHPAFAAPNGAESAYSAGFQPASGEQLDEP